MVKTSILRWLQKISSYDATNLKAIVKLCVPTWTIFPGPVTYVCSYTFIPNTIITFEHHTTFAHDRYNYHTYLK